MSEIVYPYHDEHDTLSYEVVRGAGKRFWQRRPDGKGEYIHDLKDVERLPYRLPELLGGISAGQTVWIVEGEKDADRLRTLGLCATTTSGGAKPSAAAVRKNLPPRLSAFLQGATRIVVIGDNDAAGETYARELGELAAAACFDVRIISPIPNSPRPKFDVSDYLDEGGTLESLLAVVESTHPTTPTAVQTVGDDNATGSSAENDAPNGKMSPADRLVRALEDDNIDLFHDDAGMCYASYMHDDHQETFEIASATFQRYCRLIFFKRTRKAIPKASLSDALGVLSAKALYEGAQRRVALRSTRIGDVVYIDLANSDWQVVEVAASRHRIISAVECPVRFNRRPGMLALPIPGADGDLQLLDRFLPTSFKGGILVIACLIASLYSGMALPVLNITGPQGSGKSNVARRLRALVDPNDSPLRSEPHDPRDIAAAARNNYICAFDNVSKLPPWLSDTLCRLATGGGFSARKLYTDDDEHVVQALRPVILTAIENVVLRGDLADRTITINLALIDERTRRSEAEMDAEFEIHRPGIFGALLRALSSALRLMPQVDRTGLGRMADFELLGRAAAGAIGLASPSDFADLYRASRISSSREVTEASPLTTELYKLAHRATGWSGTFQQLFKAIVPDDGRDRSAGGWPKTSRGLSGEIARLLPDLRAVGIDVVISEPGRNRTRVVTITTAQQGSESTSATSATSASLGQSGERVADVIADVRSPIAATSAPELPAIVGVVDVADVADVADVVADEIIW